MRAPRYRFPDEVRSTTRAMGSRMVEQGRLAGSADELERWIESEPAARVSLERGGYGTAFTAQDLFPLLEVFIAQAGGEIERPEERSQSLSAGVRLALIFAVLVGITAAVVLLVVS